MGTAIESPVATIAICSHNRSAQVARCLASLAPQARRLGFPILLADSASTPEQAAQLQTLADGHGAGLVRCDQPGLSLARNRAASRARGQWIVYVDDDALAFPDWATRLSDSLAAMPDDVAVVGGLVRASWPDGAKHDHIGRRWKLLLSCTDRPGAGPVPGFDICGANFAVRREFLSAVGGFPARLGRIGGRLISGEESFLIELLRRKGLKARYDARFGVDHCIPTERMTVAWALKRAYWEGISRVCIHRELDEPLPASMQVWKLAASLPLLSGLAPLSSEYAIRWAMAWGSLRAQVSRH